jgi:proline dehydrogenase
MVLSSKEKEVEMSAFLQNASRALRCAALDLRAKDFVLQNEVLFNVFRKAASRYMGGDTLEETIEKVVAHNNKGLKCSIEFMGESTKSIAEANEAADEFLKIVRSIASLNLQSTVSLDLSHIGLSVSSDLCVHHLNRILIEADKTGIEVILSAEDTERTDDIISVYKSTSPSYSNLGITLQAYLHRTSDDFKELLQTPGRIRIVKGAFETATGLSMPRGAELNTAYLGYVSQLLATERKCSIATHDAFIQQEVVALINKYGPSPASYEFESLYGVCTDALIALKDNGHPAKMYFVYGREWWLYLCNRIAEYPLNLFRALTDIAG